MMGHLLLRTSSLFSTPFSNQKAHYCLCVLKQQSKYVARSNDFTVQNAKVTLVLSNVLRNY